MLPHSTARPTPRLQPVHRHSPHATREVAHEVCHDRPLSIASLRATSAADLSCHSIRSSLAICMTPCHGGVIRFSRSNRASFSAAAVPPTAQSQWAPVRYTRSRHAVPPTPMPPPPLARVSVTFQEPAGCGQLHTEVTHRAACAHYFSLDLSHMSKHPCNRFWPVTPTHVPPKTCRRSARS